MRKTRKTWVLVSLVALAFVLVVGNQVYGLFLALGRQPTLSFTNPGAGPKELKEFLSGNFVLVERMRSLLWPVRLAFTEIGGRRLTMANPGELFEATDVFLLPGMPQRRLIFAGVSGDKCFVHFEAGGVGHWYGLALFKIVPSDQLEPFWQGSCGKAKGMRDLRDQIEHGDCQSQ